MSQFASVVVNLEDEIENPGDTLPVAGHIDAATYKAGEKSFSLDDGISYDVMLTNTGDGVLATGIVRAACHRRVRSRLDVAHFEVASEIEEYYLFDEPEDPESYEDGFELVSEDRTIDLSDAIADGRRDGHAFCGSLPSRLRRPLPHVRSES